MKVPLLALALGASTAALALPRAGEDGLWKIRFADGTALSAADCVTNGAACLRTEAADGIVREWKASSATVRVIERREASGKTVYVGVLTPHGKTATDFDLPATMRFDGISVNRFTMPQGTEWGLGIAFNRKAFADDPSRPMLWRNGSAKGDPTRVWGASLPAATDRRLAHFHSHPIGKGRLWMPPALFKDGQMAEILGDFEQILRAGRDRRKVCALQLSGARVYGAYAADIPTMKWLSRICRTNLAGAEGVALSSVEALKAALKGDDCRLIVNVYGSQLPARDQQEMDELLALIGAYVRAGGEWVELTPRPFSANLEPAGSRFYYPVTYPSAFADFAHGDFSDGTWTFYGVQPRGAHEPWKNPKIHQSAVLACGTDCRGGYFRHTWKTYAKSGETVEFPPVVIAEGRGLQAACDDYVAANALTRPFDEKVKDAELRRKLVASTCILLEPTPSLAWRREALKRIPPPSIVHISQYARHMYPDHYPLRDDFGTDEEFRAFLREAKELGLVVCPYTNPTWWVDGAPSLVREGASSAAIGLDGRPLRESWPEGKGWATTPWHPVTRQCNRRTVDLFTKDFPVDLLFQDQVGARGFRYDFNPSAPTPLAYCEGLVSAAEEDARRVPLATEQGWDQVANVEALCVNFAFGYLPTVTSDFGTIFRNRFPPDMWESEPIVLRMMHGKTMFMYHDLCFGCWTPQALAWLLPHGFKLSWHFWKEYADSCPYDFEWLEFLTRLQQAFTAPAFACPLTGYRHDRGCIAAEGRDLMNPDDDGTLETHWGPYAVWSNLGPRPRTLNGVRLAPYGFLVTGPGLRAVTPAGELPSVETNGVRWTMSIRLARERYRFRKSENGRRTK